MKNTSYYIQPVNVDNKPTVTVCEAIRNILWYIAQFAGCIAIFAMMYTIVFFASVFC